MSSINGDVAHQHKEAELVEGEGAAFHFTPPVSTRLLHADLVVFTTRAADQVILMTRVKAGGGKVACSPIPYPTGFGETLTITTPRRRRRRPRPLP
jgi:hypothetical protein